MHYSKHCFCHKIIRYGSVVVFGFIMILLSHLTGLHEFMFPEGISVVLGVWAVERQPWRVNKAQLFFMMIIGSICAVCIVKYLPIPLIFQVLIGFILVGISLLVTKTSFAPVVSAFMLPILSQKRRLFNEFLGLRRFWRQSGNREQILYFYYLFACFQTRKEGRIITPPV